MIKNNKLKLAISSLVIVLPAILAAVFRDRLEIKELPLFLYLTSGIMLLVHWLCLIITDIDNRKRNQSPKVLGLLFWICPLISLLTFGVFAAIILDAELKMSYILGPILGISMMLFGNYLPKCKQNFVIGMRISFTLANEENWNKTHRFAGKLWVVGGAMIVACSLLPDMIFLFAMIGIVIAVSAIPVIYSYRYYKKQLNDGRYEKTDELKTIKKQNKKYLLITLTSVLIVATVISVISFTGKITVEFSDESFTVNSTYFSKLTVNYSDIESAELCVNVASGTKVVGYNSPRMHLGSFKNDEYGSYTRYTYTACDTCIVLSVNGKTVVINGDTNESTRAIYENILSHAGGL